MDDFNWAQWIGYVGLFFIFVLLIMWLWNIVMPVFGLPELTYWQAFVLKVLSNLLFGHKTSLGNSEN